MMPGPIDELRAVFQNVFTSIKPFVPPPTDAIKTSTTCPNLALLPSYLLT
jgi:hypothetical protein